MIRIAISVEGATERDFVKNVLAPYFAERSLFVYPVDMRGRVSVERAVSDIVRLMSTHDVTTTLYDFYGMKEQRQGMSVDEIQAHLTAEIHGSCSDSKDRFIPYIQMHEFEALLFSSPQIFAEEMGDVSKSVLIEKIVVDAGGAENVNDGYETCPSRRIEKMFPQFNKVLHGSVVGAKIGIDKMKDKCPRFAAWIEQIESVSRA